MREKISFALVALSIVCLFILAVVYFYALHMWQNCPAWTEYVGGGAGIGVILFFALAVLIYPDKYWKKRAILPLFLCSYGWYMGIIRRYRYIVDIDIYGHL